jgi:hypothetical protein
MKPPTLFDDEFDRRLNDVLLPAGLLGRLRAVPLVDDTDLDDMVADVPVPADLVARWLGQRGIVTRVGPASSQAPVHQLRRQKTEGRREKVSAFYLPPSAFVRQAAAAMVVFAVGMGYTLSVVAFVAPRFEQRAWSAESRASLVVVSQLSDPLIEQTASELELPPIDVAFPAIDDSDITDEALSQIRASSPPNRRSVAELTGEPLALASAEAPRFSAWPPTSEASVDNLDARPIDRAVVRLDNTGPFDRRFWRQTGLLPWLDSSKHPSIETPLVGADAGYRFFRREIRSGRLPRVADVRVEEIVAGVDYGLAKNGSSEASLVLAAAPSPFTDPFEQLPADGGGTSRWLVMIAAIPEPSGQDARVYAPSLKLTFSSEHVVRYRIIGYGPSDIGSRASEDGRDDDETNRVDFAHGAAVTLCEIAISSDCDPQAELLRVHLVSPPHYARDGLPMPSDATVTPGDGLGRPPHVRTANTSLADAEGSVQATAVLRAAAFAGDFDAAPVAWRQAALVALAAEQLAGSPFAGLISLGEIAAFARQIEPAVCDRPGWRDFIETIVRAQSLRVVIPFAFSGCPENGQPPKPALP